MLYHARYFYLIFCLFFFPFYVWASDLKQIETKETSQQTEIHFTFTEKSDYHYAYMANPQRLILDFTPTQQGKHLLPYQVKTAGSMVKRIRYNYPVKPHSLRVVIDLNAQVKAQFKRTGNKIIVIFAKNNLPSHKLPVWTIAIDPGHGGKDPGAIGRRLKIYEKHVTLSIAKELKLILDRDPNFKAILTRTGDYFVSVSKRSEIARKNKANYLISIHADSSPGSISLRGASVWVLSNKRASDEMGKWLEDHERQSELLGGTGNILATHAQEKYLNQTVLDLQFGYAQREGYTLGDFILKKMAQITPLSRKEPRHASLGVLRSPDIPSILVETGFLSHPEEEKQLNQPRYRRLVAQKIYEGLVEYRRYSLNIHHNPIVTPTLSTNRSSTIQTSPLSTQAVEDSGIRHKVKSGETLMALTRQYDVTLSQILQLNQLTRDRLFIGEIIKIPSNHKQTIQVQKTEPTKKPLSINNKQSSSPTTPSVHWVTKGDTLHSLSQRYHVPISTLQELNHLKGTQINIGQKLKLN